MKLITDIPAEWKNISSLFVALGDEQRQRILLAFVTTPTLAPISTGASAAARARRRVRRAYRMVNCLKQHEPRWHPCAERRLSRH